MAQAMGLLAGAGAVEVAEAIRTMNAQFGLPYGLAAMGVTADGFDRIIALALADHCHKTNPRLATAEDYQALLSESL